MRLVPFVFALVAACFVASTAQADAPRAAVVVVGDPAEATVAAATGLSAALSASSELALPSDAAMRSALLGSAAPEVEDGLAPVRAIRRQLGWSDDGDREALATIGRQLELAAIVLVRGGEIPIARVYDVGAARYFAGEAPVDAASIETSAHFVVARVRAAEQRRHELPTPEATAAASTDPTSHSTASTSSPLASGPATAATEAPRRRSWIARNWPYLLAGALVAGTTTFFIAQRDTSAGAAPVIHVRPGGTP